MMIFDYFIYYKHLFSKEDPSYIICKGKWLWNSKKYIKDFKYKFKMAIAQDDANAMINPP